MTGLKPAVTQLKQEKQSNAVNNCVLKALIINDFTRIGGAEQVILQVMKHLQGPDTDNHWEISVIASGPGPFIDACHKVPITSIHCVDLMTLKARWKNPRAWRQTRCQLTDTVAVIDPDVIIANSVWAALVIRSVARAAGIPVLCALHAEIQPKRMDKRLAMNIMGRYLLQGLHRWITVSDQLAAQLQHYRIPRNIITVIPNGVHIPATNPRTCRSATTSWRDDHNISADALVIACVGRLHPGKGQHVVLEAFTQLSAISETVHLVITGEETVTPGDRTDYTAKLKKMTTLLNGPLKAHLTGFIPDVTPLLMEADIVVSGSAEESFGLAVLEGMAAGCAVIATAVGGHCRTVTHRQDGLLVPVNDVPAMTEALDELVSNPDLRLKLSQRASVRAADFNILSTLRLWESTIQGVIKAS